jgi:hypothetical protein
MGTVIAQETRARLSKAATICLPSHKIITKMAKGRRRKRRNTP